jgi:hypothetical protein
MNDNNDLIGQLYINTSKSGVVYLRGHVNKQKVVCFLNKKDGQSYSVLADTRETAQGTNPKPPYKKPQPNNSPF